MLDYINISIICAIVSYIYCDILIQQGHILHVPFMWLKSKLTYNVKVRHEIPEALQKNGIAYTETLQPKEHWLIKPLGGCSICFSGQLSLWTLLLNGMFDPIYLIIHISITILTIKLITKWVN